MTEEEIKELKEQLFEDRKNGWCRIADNEKEKVFTFSEGYKSFLKKCKTEREVCDFYLEKVKNAGFKNIDEMTSLKPGDKIYKLNRGKAIIMAVIGKSDINEGINITAAHIDSPRLDFKQHPLFESDEIAYLKTQYYGGIRKYQWPTMPLSLHGVIIRSDGEKIKINIGEDEGDPKFVISDLLPHLSQEQNKRNLPDGIKGEELNIIVGSRPFKDTKEADSVKLNILSILNEKYGITESDLISAELEAVPAFEPCDIGLDRSLIGAYGHDDRVCAYPAAEAILNLESVPNKTAVTVLTDKEEIGSDGNTGLCSAYLYYFIDQFTCLLGGCTRTVLSNSECLSADVDGAFDPSFPEPFDKRNSCHINRGSCITKYTGGRGKSSSSDASAEFTGKIRNLMDKNNVIWQTGELGKVDVGGGGTVAKYIAALNVDVIDMGVPVLSMHSPFEIISKLDIYMTYRAFCVFMEA